MLARIGKEIKTLTNEKYQEFVSGLEIHRIFCSCGHAGCLVRHGYYRRKLKTADGTVTLRILRVRCKECGRTHAILPECVVPYSRIPVDIQQKMITHRLGDPELEDLMTCNPDITESDVLRTRRSFKRYWRQRLLSIGIDIAAQITQIIGKCYQEFRRQFMQIKRGIYQKFLPST